MSIFSSVPMRKPVRSTQNLSHDHLTSTRFGVLSPLGFVSVAPGDRFKKIGTQSLVRAMPLVTPMMQRCRIYTHFFYVPYRIVWNKWDDFFTAGADGISDIPMVSSPVSVINSAIDYLVTFMGFSSADAVRLCDQIGLPIKTYNGPGSASSFHVDAPDDLHVNMLPFLAYQLIWREYYSDENLTFIPDVIKDLPNVNNVDFYDESVVASLICVRQRAWGHDYFTSSLPWPQKGPDVEIPGIQGGITATLGNELRASGHVYTDDFDAPGFSPNKTVDYHGALHRVQGDSTEFSVVSDPSKHVSLRATTEVDSDQQVNLYDVSADGVSINSLRTLLATQRYFEALARGGSRKKEYLLSLFGVRSKDSRLDRPEYIGGVSSPLQIGEVLQTSSTDSTSPQANMAGVGIGSVSGKPFKKFCDEFGVIIPIMSIIPDAIYSQGIDRELLKFDRFHYLLPPFASIGEQEVWQAEVYGASEKSFKTFGYMPRYTEYRFKNSSVHGELRPGRSLENWTLARFFPGDPNLNHDFVTVESTKDNLGRVFAVEESDVNDQFVVQTHQTMIVRRNVPKFGIPSIL